MFAFNITKHFCQILFHFQFCWWQSCQRQKVSRFFPILTAHYPFVRQPSFFTFRGGTSDRWKCQYDTADYNTVFWKIRKKFPLLGVFFHLALTNYNVGTRMYDENLKSRNNNIRRHRHIIRSSNYFCLIIIMADMEGGGVSRLSDCIIQHQSWYRLPPPISFKPLIFSKTFFQLSFFGVRISSLYLQ